MKLAPVTADDFDRLAPFFEGQPHPLCVYSLAAILCWRNARYHPCAAIHGDTLVIAAEFTPPAEERHLILPLRRGGGLADPATLRDLALACGHRAYWYVPEGYLAAYGGGVLERLFTVRETPELSDYIYTREDLAELRGNRFSAKRNLVRQFERQYAAAGRLAIAPIGAGDKAECAAFLEQWCRERDCDADPREDLACEKQAVLHALEDLERLALRGLLLRIDGRVSAFAIAADLSAGMGALHFEKAFAGIKGLYQFFDRECARRLFGPERRLINKESDMGLPGLAKAKRSYHPAHLAGAYRLDLKSAR
jgi:hypothetical protein